MDELGDLLEGETERDSSVDDKTKLADNNLDGSSLRALPLSRSSLVSATGPLAFHVKVMGII